MAYNIKDLKVSSLDYSDIVNSLTTFLEEQPDLSSIDFRNSGSAANMLINILATATAYNGVYSYFGFNESFKTSAQNLESFAGLASNESILLPFTQSATITATIEATSLISAYTPFVGIASDGSTVYFYCTDDITVGTDSYTLYGGSQVVTYTDYDVNSQTILIPTTVDPRTITFTVTDIINSTDKTYTRIDKGEEADTLSNVFTVINGPNGYLVTNNLINSTKIDLNYKVTVKAVISNGSLGNNASVTAVSGTTFITSTNPTGGYSEISVEKARSTVLINGIGRKRWVTLNDLKHAVVSSGILGTENIDDVTVSNGSSPGSVKVYVDSSLTDENITNLLTYLYDIGPAGIVLEYSL